MMALMARKNYLQGYVSEESFTRQDMRHEGFVRYANNRRLRMFSNYTKPKWHRVVVRVAMPLQAELFPTPKETFSLGTTGESDLFCF